MTPASNRDPLRLLMDRNPAPNDEVEAATGTEERAAMLKLARERATQGTDRPNLGRGSSFLSRRRGVRLVAVGLVAAAILTLVTSLGGSGDRSGAGVGYAAAAVRVAEVNPRILVTASGWSINHVEPLEPDSGETQFSDGTSELDITWYPAHLYDDYREGRSHVDGPDTPIEVLGVTGTMVQYGEGDFATMLPPQGDVFVEIRGYLRSEDAYREILSSLETTDVDTWLAAMPADVVQPDDQGAVVASLLQDVPLPPGFDLDGLEHQSVLNADGLRLKVADTVACGWLDSWAEAHASGDEAAMAEASKAMATADDWPVMLERPVSGGHSRAILDFARQISDGHLDQSFGSVIATNENGVSYGYGPAYAVVLSCDSMTKRRMDDLP